MSSSAASPTLTSEGLFSIDVTAEVRKLCGEQFASDAERLAQMVRVLIGSGATSLTINSGRGGTTITAPGAVLPGALVELTATLRAATTSPAARHAALAKCEEQASIGHLVFAGEPDLLLESDTRRLEIKQGVANLTSCPQTAVTLVKLRRRVSPVDCRSFAKLCRFASLKIELGGKQISFGRTLANALCWDSFEGSDYDGVVGLPAHEEICRTVFLCRELVCRETYGVSPNGYAHTAVVHDRVAQVPSQVRRDLLSKVVRRQRVGLYKELARKLPHLTAQARRKARDLLIMRAERSGDLDALAGVPIFERIRGPASAPEELAEHAVEGVLWAVEPGQVMRWRHVAVGRRIFVLSRRERALVEKALTLCCSEPPQNNKDALWLHKLRDRVLPMLNELWATLIGRMFCSLPLDRQTLEAGERCLVQAMSAELKSGRYVLKGLPPGLSAETIVALAERALLPARRYRIDRQAVLLLPRHHPLVLRAAEAVCSDGRAVYPAMLALLAGYDGYGANKEAAQTAWLAPTRLASTNSRGNA